MSSLFRQVIPAQQILETLSNTELFVSWLHKLHPNQDPKELFEGYQFATIVCINSIIDGFCYDTQLGLESDFLFERCLGEWIPLHEINSISEKANLLRQIKPSVKKVAKSKNYYELKVSLAELEILFLHRIEKLRQKNITLKDLVSFSKEQANCWLCIDFLHTFLHQIKGNGPVANFVNPIMIEPLKKERLDIFLDGYKYALQFCWCRLLGDEKYHQTRLTQIHLADSWNTYHYNKQPKSKNSGSSLFDRTFELEKQTCFDSYFYHIQKEVTEPIESDFKLKIYEISREFVLDSSFYNKEQLFGDLLVENNSKQRTSSLNREQRFSECLYWYPLTAITDGTTMTEYGPASFNTLLAGTVTLHNPKQSVLPKVVVAKFTHPNPSHKGKYSYSFGMLIDGGSAASDQTNGWIIYHNLCWDYSGFANFQYENIMRLINRFQRKGKIDLREMTIPLSEFEVLIGNEMLQSPRTNVNEKNKQLKMNLKDSNSFLFEVITAYLCSKIYPGVDIELNTDKKTANGEIDVKIESDEVLILVECKLNPNNYSIEEMINKLSKKLVAKVKPLKQKSMEFWFWIPPSETNKKLLEEKRIIYHVISNPNWIYSRYVPLKTLKQLWNNEI